MMEQLALWGARLEALETKAGEQAAAETIRRLEGWKSALVGAQAKLALLEPTGDTWDAVKAELEVMWRAMEHVLDDGSGPGASLSAEEIRSLSAAQQDRLLEAMVIAVAADGRGEKAEVARLEAEVGKVPWAQPQDEVRGKMRAALARVAAANTSEERLAMVDSIAATLPAGVIREKALAMMARVMGVERAGDAVENPTLARFAVAFGIPNERLAELASSLT